MNISLFPNISTTKNGAETSIDRFIDDVQAGKWQDQVLKYRTLSDDTAKTLAKRNIPYVTISGTFSERKEKGLDKHSGFICMDFDHTDPNEAKSILGADKFVYCVFTSVGGNGVAALCRIKPNMHLESFNALSAHFMAEYGMAVDVACKDISRARYVSYDPEPVLNLNSEIIQPKKEEKKKPVRKVPFVHGDFENIIDQITRQSLDITGGYTQWRDIGFALADKFGSDGWDYFLAVSQFSSSYDLKKTEDQWKRCVKGKGSGIHIGTFYYYAKQFGISTVSEQTLMVTQAAAMAKKSRRSPESAVKTLQELGRIKPEQASAAIDLAKQVQADDVQPESTNVVDDMLEYLSQNYKLQKNSITRNIEVNGQQITDSDINYIFLNAKRVIPETSKDITSNILFSHFIESYNPFDVIKSSPNTTGNLLKLIQSIQSPTQDYDVYIKKWLISMMASIDGKHSRLFLVLVGGQSIGKTEFFRRLLPIELSGYIAESKMDQGKDEHILMTKNIIVLDDEMSGKSKQEWNAMKSLTSVQTFDIREPYGRVSAKLNRIAMLCGTSNEFGILNDPTGNTRFLPIHVLKIDYELFNSIDKLDLLKECWAMYQEGETYQLTREENERLQGISENFKEVCPEEELFLSYFDRPNAYEDLALTNSEIISELQAKTRLLISSKKMGSVLRTLGYERFAKKIDGATRWEYHVSRLKK